MISIVLAIAAVSNCTATDGDTIRCGGERVRIVGIDAPEMPGHCRVGRTCVKGPGQPAKSALARFLATGEVQIERTGVDRYGRTLGHVFVGGRSAACAMLASGLAVSRYDGGRTARRCFTRK